MRRKKRPLWLLVTGCISLILLIALMLAFSPGEHLFLGSIKIPTVPVFFTILFFASCTLSSFVFGNGRRGVLIGIFVTIYFLLRFLHLTHTFFLLLLAALFLTIELLFLKQK